MIGMGEMRDGLYIINGRSCKDITVNQTSSQVWDDRMGHLSFKKFEPLKKLLNYSTSSKNCHCSVCHLAKQRRLFFVSSNKLSENCFYFIHCDV